jgi:plastocyanin
MKKTIIASTLATLSGFSFSASAMDSLRSMYMDEHYVSIGVDMLDINVDRFELSTSSPALTLGYGYRFNQYIEFGATASILTDREIVDESVDTYINADQSNGEVVVGSPMETTYRNTITNSYFAGIHAKFLYPINRNFDLYATVGGTYGQIEHEGFTNVGDRLVDTPNLANNTEEYLNGIAKGLTACELTGVEEICGRPISEYSEKFDSLSVSYGAGVRWMWRDSGTTHMVNAGFKSLFSQEDFDILSYGINYEYQF